MMKYHESISLLLPEEKKAYLNEIRSTFNDFLTASQSLFISFYPQDIFQMRPQIINWLIFIRNTLSLSLETLFQCVSLFDKYISLSSSLSSNMHYTPYDINLICIACLSLSAKEEEVNCNYIKFFTENILNTPLCQMYTVKDVAKKEIEILKQLKFKTNNINAYHFNKLYMELFKEFNYPMCYAKLINEEIMLQYLSSGCYLSYSPDKIALCAFNGTLLNLSVYYSQTICNDNHNNYTTNSLFTLNQINECKNKCNVSNDANADKACYLLTYHLINNNNIYPNNYSKYFSL